jgi:hypothetical protein
MLGESEVRWVLMVALDASICELRFRNNSYLGPLKEILVLESATTSTGTVSQEMKKSLGKVSPTWLNRKLVSLLTSQ